jgi:phosphoglycerate dehydrogenase-like enzyme
MAAIAILDDYQNVALRMADWSKLQEQHELVVFNQPLPDMETAAQAIARFEIISIMRERTPFPRALLERLPNLRLLVTTGKRNASIDMQAAQDLKITVCGSGGAGRATAELAIALMLGLARHLREEFHAMRPGGGWQTSVGFALEGRTLGVIGLGNLGAKVAAIAGAMGMPVIAWSENLSPERAVACGAVRVDKEELFRRADVISIHTVLSSRTRGLVGAGELALMKPTAILVNTSRGPIVDETALLSALSEGRIAGYGADTFHIEPLPADHPLRSQPRALLTPHIGYVTEETYRSFYTGTVAAIEGWLSGNPVEVLV